MARRSATTLAVLMSLATVGCTSSTAPDEAPAGTTGVGKTSAEVAFDLRTHCGIDEARFEGRYYEAVHPLSDGSGNPPDGWGNPYQSGTMQVVSANEAEFRDGAGHVVLFRLRPQATAFQRLCLD
ncbi:hypothetical protein [Micromonospora sp. NPDC093277]|uniref:hypothetical protein n=1 Tax=Micromonospora sp. NPDC093277 TaxID=3364291 RepID=UPI0037F5D423